jgi:hypothetical protein
VARTSFGNMGKGPKNHLVGKGLIGQGRKGTRGRFVEQKFMLSTNFRCYKIHTCKSCGFGYTMLCYLSRTKMFNKPTSAVTGKSFGNIANGPQTARNSYENRGKDLQWPVKPEELQCHLATLQKAKAG